MTAAASSPPAAAAVRPTTALEAAELIRSAAASGTPVYPRGGATSLHQGLPVKAPGVPLDLTALARVVDYPARDMTVTVEAGVRFAHLSALLAQEAQQLPFDPPHASAGTVGGIVATNFNGPRRYGYGAIRDAVIGIEAIDGTGRVFHGGGRVVKNVAGYDFCKLLTGSWGTIGVVTQVTFKVQPLPETAQLVAAAVQDAAHAERVLEALTRTVVTPTAVELLAGPVWQGTPSLVTLWNCGGPNDATPPWGAVVLRLEGSAKEVAWMTDRLRVALPALQCRAVELVPEQPVWSQIVEFPADVSPPLVVKAQVVPSGVTRFCDQLRTFDSDVSWLAHAGQGTVIVRLSRTPRAGAAKALIQHLQPWAAALGGSVTLLSHAGDLELTRQMVWSGAPAGLFLMQRIKTQFDPHDILNRGRYVFAPSG